MLKKGKSNDEELDEELSKSFKEKADSSLKSVSTFFMKNRKKNLKSLIFAFTCIVLIVLIMVVSKVSGVLNLINRDGNTGNPNATFTETDDNNFDGEKIDAQAANSIDQYCIQWATTGEKLYSSKVINVLLVGRDSKEDDANSDTIIIASVNTEKKTISLCSIMRDSYTYSNIQGSARCDKINHTYAWGGENALITTLEDDLKIEIDHFVSIDFQGFRDMIDEIGGVDVDVTEAEADYMNKTTQIKGFESGSSVHLDGEHALVYARIRKLDNDNFRTERQRKIITAVINKLKNSTSSQLNNLVNKVVKYISTDCTNKEILSYASKAISGGWLKFTINELTEPGENTRFEGMMTTYSSRENPLFVFIVDWASVAREVQTMLYGTTNIVIDPDSYSSPVDIARSGVANGSETTTSEQTTRVYTTEYTGIMPDFVRPTNPPATMPDEDVTEPYTETDESTDVSRTTTERTSHSQRTTGNHSTRTPTERSTSSHGRTTTTQTEPSTDYNYSE